MRLFDAVIFSAATIERAYDHCSRCSDAVRALRQTPFGWRRFSIATATYPDCNLMIVANELGSFALYDAEKFFDWTPIENGLYGGMLNETGCAVRAKFEAEDVANIQAASQTVDDDDNVSADYAERVSRATRLYFLAVAVLAGVMEPQKQSTDILLTIGQIADVKLSRSLPEFISENVERPQELTGRTPHEKSLPPEKSWQEFERAAAAITSSLSKNERTRRH